MYRYLGAGGECYPGVPARDLSAEEVAALDPERRQDVRSGKLYRAEADAASEAALPEPAGEFAYAPPTAAEMGAPGAESSPL